MLGLWEQLQSKDKDGEVPLHAVFTVLRSPCNDVAQRVKHGVPRDHHGVLLSQQVLLRSVFAAGSLMFNDKQVVARSLRIRTRTHARMHARTHARIWPSQDAHWFVLCVMARAWRNLFRRSECSFHSAVAARKPCAS